MFDQLLKYFWFSCIQIVLSHLRVHGKEKAEELFNCLYPCNAQKQDEVSVVYEFEAEHILVLYNISIIY